MKKYAIRTIHGGEGGYFNGKVFGNSINFALTTDSITELIQQCFKASRNFREDVEVVEICLNPIGKVI